MISLSGFGRGASWNGHRRSVFSLKSGVSVSPRKNAVPSGVLADRPRKLGQGAPSTEPLSEEERQKITDFAAVALESLELAFFKLSDQYRIAVDQGTFRNIPIIGPTFSQGEILTQMVLVAGEIAGLAAEIGRSAEPYLTEDEISVITELHLSAQALISETPRAMQEDILQEHLHLSREHIDSYLATPRLMKGDLDRAIVEAEAQGIPVKEPFPKKLALTVAGGAAIVLLVILALGE